MNLCDPRGHKRDLSLMNVFHGYDVWLAYQHGTAHLASNDGLWSSQLAISVSIHESRANLLGMSEKQTSAFKSHVMMNKGGSGGTNIHVNMRSTSNIECQRWQHVEIIWNVGTATKGKFGHENQVEALQRQYWCLKQSRLTWFQLLRPCNGQNSQ